MKRRRTVQRAGSPRSAAEANMANLLRVAIVSHATDRSRSIVPQGKPPRVSLGLARNELAAMRNRPAVQLVHQVIAGQLAYPSRSVGSEVILASSLVVPAEVGVEVRFHRNEVAVLTCAIAFLDVPDDGTHHRAAARAARRWQRHRVANRRPASPQICLSISPMPGPSGAARSINVVGSGLSAA